MGIEQVSLVLLLLLLFTVCCVRVYSEVIDVDIGLSENSYTYTADLDSQQLEYRCVSSGSSDGLVWKSTASTLTNPISAYQFYGVVRAFGTFSISCYSGTNKLGEMELTIKDNANFTIKYSGTREVYPFSSGKTPNATIPLDTSDIKITCEVSRGAIVTPSDELTAVTTNPSVTLSLTDSTTGNYECYRLISSSYIILITLTIEAGANITPITTQTSTTTTTTTTTTATPLLVISVPTTVPIVLNTFLSTSQYVPSTDTTDTTTLHTLTTSHSTNETHTPYTLGPVPIAVVTLCIVCCCCLATCVILLFLMVSCYYSHHHEPRYKNQSPEERTGGYYELPTYEEMETLGLPVRSSDRLKSELMCLLADSGRELEAQFHSILIRTQQPSNIAFHPDNVAKNRHPSLVPYDCNRVVLGDGSYVNASYIPLDTRANGFIATQGPLREGVGDLWRLIGESQISCVVQLANAVENGRRKCERYWPLEGTGRVNVSGVEVELSGVTEYGDWCRREIAVAEKGKSRIVTQFHFTEWSSGTFPTDTSGFIRMLRGVKEFHDQQRPICVVCIDGVGRSGAFILLYSALCLLESQSPVCLRELLATMRQSRASMVLSVDQYRYCSLCAQELAFGDTSVPLSRFHSFYQEATSSEGIRFSEEFLQLAFVTKHSLRGQPENVSQEPLPFEGNRVLLRSGEHINASYFELGGVRNRLIGTQNPTRHTIRAFLQLLWDTRPDRVVMLETEIGFDRVVSSDTCYWPEEGLQMKVGTFTVSCLSSERSGGLVRQRLSLTNQVAEETHEFSHLILLDWEGSGVPTNPHSVVSLASECVLSGATSPLVVHCRDCVGMSGVFVVSCRALWQMKQEGRVDIFSLVKRARCERQDMISTQEQYRSCYRLVESAVTGTEYQNLSSIGGTEFVASSDCM